MTPCLRRMIRFLFQICVASAKSNEKPYETRANRLGGQMLSMLKSYWTVIKTRKALAVFALTPVLAASCGPPHGINGPRVISFAHLHDIGVAIERYRQNHGEWPPTLSALVPEYISVSRLSVFYVTNETASRAVPSDWMNNPARVDEFSAYVYLGSKGPQGIAAFERTNLWKWSPPHLQGRVAVLHPDGSVQMMRLEDLQKFLRK